MDPRQKSHNQYNVNQDYMLGETTDNSQLYQVENRPMFNGRRMRDQKERKMVDFHSTIITEYIQRRLYRPSLPYNIPYYLPPQQSYERILLPMSSTIGNESHGILKRLERVSKNSEKSPINVVSFTPSGRRLVTGSAKGEFTLWDGKGFHFVTLQHAHSDPIRAMSWDHSGRYLVSGDQMGVVKYWEITMNNAKEFIAHHSTEPETDKYGEKKSGHGAAVRDISFAPNDVHFVTCSDDCTLKIWNFHGTVSLNTLTGHGSEIMSCEWHPYHSIIASGSKDHSVRLWDVNSGKQIANMESHKSTVFRVRWNKNGNWLLSSSRDLLIHLYDIRYLKPMSTFNGHKTPVHSIEWHPFHERLFASGGNDGTLMYWIVGSSEEEGAAGVIDGAHTQCIWDMDWHPLGHVLCTGSRDGTIKFWIRERLGVAPESNRNRVALQTSDDMDTDW